MKRKSSNQEVKKLREILHTRNIQIASLKRVLWGIVHQEGGTYVISPDIFDKCHTVSAKWDTELDEETGAFTITVDYDNETVDRVGKADEILPLEDK